MSAVEKATRVLAEDHEAVWDHDVSYYMPLRCRCGVDRPDGAASDETWHAAHQAQALADAGLLADDPAGEPETCRCRGADRPHAPHQPCDMGCQPDWHRDGCAIYLLAQPATAPSEDVEAILRAHGLSDTPNQYDSSIHSWRCEYPDHYGPCSCFDDLLADLHAHDAQVRADERRTTLLRAAASVPRAPGDQVSVATWLRGMAEGGDGRG